MTSKELRQSFLNFFSERGHRIVQSAPVIPHGDPTLLFTNAGMNQFKDVFLGIGKRDYARCADTQKCIRVSGKHNDLEEVGHDAYHHTFFEMLGNWSFGDYYKKEAIGWSWELLTKIWGLPKERLHATVYRADDESFEIWRQYLPDKQIHRFDEKDNFWEMGATGPCGPCSEIHFDRTPDLSGGALVNAGRPEVIEIWNNVFIQYNRREDGSLEELAAKHVDTGMGFERICAVMQNKNSNYDADIFKPILDKIEQISGRKYSAELTNPEGVAMRVMADHIRALTFAIADGALPGNEGRGYVLRRILRRAARYARNLGLRKPSLYKLVDVLVVEMGDVFPEIRQQQELIERVVKAEEESFLQTLERGLERFEEIKARLNIENKTIISGAEAFFLYDTCGFPFDLTELLAREMGASVSADEFALLMNEQRARSRQARKAHIQEVEMSVINASTQFTGWDELISEGSVLYAEENRIVLDKSPFYVEMGGQQADSGIITLGGYDYAVLEARKSGDAIVHICAEDVEPLIGEKAVAAVNSLRRRAIQRNHSATHILHEALRMTLGNHAQQAGSLVTPDHLRFDFSHFQKVSAKELTDIETIVNDKIRETIPIVTLELPVEQARKIPGVKMFFGDKYGDKVRVVIIDEKFSAEFCGGTHAGNSSEIGLFKITSESSIASGIRRIEAVTSAGVERYIAELHEAAIRDRELRDQLHEKIKRLEKDLAIMNVEKIADGFAELAVNAAIVKGIKFVVQKIPTVDGEQLKSLGDHLRNTLGKCGVGILATVADGKVLLACVVTDDLTGTYQAGKIVGAMAKDLGGGGGGKAHLATAGGKDIYKLDEILQSASKYIENQD